MGFIRNLAFFAVFALITTGCGGGNTVAANGTNGNLSNGGSNTGGTGGNTGTVTLKWTAPSTRADNTAASLSEISGYRLYYGTSSTDTPNYVNISNGATTQYSISLPSGSYYFRISAIDSNGYEGLKSVAIQKTI
jgi:hypothetical protein